MNPDLLWPAGLTVLLAIGALSDLKDRRLPNWLSLLLLLYGLAHAYAVGEWSGLAWHGAHSLAVLLVGMGLFALKWFGGGDVKYYVGTAAYFPLADGVALLLWISLLGAALILLWMLGRRLLSKSATVLTGPHALFPYGIAIAAGGSALAWAQSPLF